MKKFKFIYNPVSGNGVVKLQLDDIVEKFQRNGIIIVPHKLLGKNDVKNAFLDFKQEDFSGIVAAGGDGTVHDVINEIMKRKIDLPLGIIPAGTSNDFATFLGIPRKTNEAIDVIINGETKRVDLGRINNKYFINVVAGGILPSIAHKADKQLKKSMGMLAYYLKAVEEIKNIKCFNVNINIDGKEISEEILMFLILNTSIAGGLKLMPDAKVDDGYFDICLIKNCNVSETASLFIKVLRGEHVKDKKVVYLKGENIKIDSEVKVETDIDGEKGHSMPLHIEVISRAISVFK